MHTAAEARHDRPSTCGLIGNPAIHARNASAANAIRNMGFSNINAASCREAYLNHAALTIYLYDFPKLFLLIESQK